MDLTDFFDHCTPAMVPPTAFGTVPDAVPFQQSNYPHSTALSVWIEGAARQGLPTSPAISNVCAARMDWAIVDRCQRWATLKPAGWKDPVVYTRYADDLTFSCNGRGRVREILAEIPGIIKACGFKVNESKTKVQCAKAGRRIITGVAVDDQGVHPTRRAKRKARAAAYKAARRTNPHYKHRAAGLAEWCKCKPPRLGKKARKAMENVSPEEGIQIAAKAARFA
jgi:hypothetical protein